MLQMVLYFAYSDFNGNYTAIQRGNGVITIIANDDPNDFETPTKTEISEDEYNELANNRF